MSPRNAYTGIHDPIAFFEALRPARQACVDQLRRYRPSGPHYHMLQVMIAAMDVAAEFFTKRRSFYTMSNPDMVGRRVPHDA